MGHVSSGHVSYIVNSFNESEQKKSELREATMAASCQKQPARSDLQNSPNDLHNRHYGI